MRWAKYGQGCSVKAAAVPAQSAAVSSPEAAKVASARHDRPLNSR